MSCMKAPILDVDSDIDEMIWPNRVILTTIGLWPYQSNVSTSTKMLTLLRMVALIAIHSSCIVPMISLICINWGDLRVLTENGISMLCYTLVVMKSVYVAIRRDDFGVAYKLMRDFWFTAKNQQERNKLVELANQAKLFTLIFLYMACMDVTLYIVKSLVINLLNCANANGSDYVHKLPFDYWYGVNIHVSPNYELIFLIQAFSVLVIAPTAAGLDFHVMLIMMHISSQFRLVCLRLKTIGRKIYSKHDDLTREFVRELIMDIKSCIMHQQKILSAFDFVEKLMSPMNFFQFILAAVEICFIGYALVDSQSDPATNVFHAVLMGLVMVQLAVGCWSGEVIIRESTEVARVISRDIPWYVLPVHLQHHIKLIIHRSQRQCEVTAIGLQVLSLKKMTEVFNTALSYMALLRSVKE